MSGTTASFRLVRRAFLALAVCAATPTLALTQTTTGTLEGFISTQRGTVRLPGALVALSDPSGKNVGQQLTDAAGHYTFTDVPEGAYRVSASLDGFSTAAASATVTRGHMTDVSIDLPIAAVSEQVEVVAASVLGSSGDPLAQSALITGPETEEFGGAGLYAALRLLASVIEVPGGVSIKGGRPNQATTQFGSGSTLADPFTGLVRLTLPADAVDSVAVLPNPYAVEFGRFSSGLVIIRTRRAGDQWKTRLGNLDPSFRQGRHQQYKVTGLESFGPRFETGGPLINGRLFLEQTAQYRYEAQDVSSRPEDELKRSQWFSAFTRVDANLTGHHSLVGTVALFPSKTTLATLGTFTPPEASADLHNRANQVGISERAVWTDMLFAETTVQMHEYRTRVDGPGTAPMELLPETTVGNFFNEQRRTTMSYQVIETLSGSRQGPLGLQLFKAGVDLLHSRYDGSSVSRPVLIRRSDGRLVRRLDFDGPTRQSAGSTALAVFAQDRVQPTRRWYLEFGGRLDRDGVAGQINLTPRVGSAVLLDESGASVLRGGFGLFYERTPLAAAAFDMFESAVDTRYAEDGVTPVGLPVRLVHRTGELATPRSATWDLAFDHRFSATWSMHASVLDRRGSDELIVQPTRQPEEGALLLDSSGRSRYREAEVSVAYTRTAASVNVSYVRASARNDLNALTNYFDTILRPVIGANGYGPAYADVPHRLFARGRLMPRSHWLFSGVIDWRTGFPYSIVDEALELVGPRNTGSRFPNLVSLDVGVEHRFMWIKWKPWIGVRAYNALNSFQPSDVQANIGSPAFGSFYNSSLRQFRLQLRFER